MYPSTEMLISVQKYKLRYGKISPVLSTQITAPVQKNIYQSQYKNMNSRTNIFIVCATTFCSTIKYMHTTVQQYVSQYRNKNFSTKRKLSVQKIFFLKNLEKIGRYFLYAYYYVPKYMLIIVHLNKPYIFHYYKLTQLYSTKHNLTPLYHTIHPYT